MEAIVLPHHLRLILADIRYSDHDIRKLVMALDKRDESYLSDCEPSTVTAYEFLVSDICKMKEARAKEAERKAAWRKRKQEEARISAPPTVGLDWDKRDNVPDVPKTSGQMSTMSRGITGQCPDKEKRRVEESRVDKIREDSINNTKRFTPPSVDEVSAYCKERNNGIDAEQFVDFYTAKGWRIGNNPMKDWKAAVRTWEQRKRMVSSSNQSQPTIRHADNWRSTTDDQRAQLRKVL